MYIFHAHNSGYITSIAVNKKITLIAADQKLVRRLAAKTKLTEQHVVEKALETARSLFKLITQGITRSQVSRRL